jgi:hypothetical protein
MKTSPRVFPFAAPILAAVAAPESRGVQARGIRCYVSPSLRCRDLIIDRWPWLERGHLRKQQETTKRRVVGDFPVDRRVLLDGRHLVFRAFGPVRMLRMALAG